jgi:subtilisin family serine protease
VNAPLPTGGLISSFSSYGLAADLSLKPDIGAPGGLIRSTYPIELGSYAVISGTSMASPHVAGSAALLLQSWKGKGDDDDDDDDDRNRTELVRDILQNSADPKNWQGNPGLGFLDQVHRQGAGMVDIDDAILATSLVTPGKLSLGEGTTAITKRLKVRNNSKSAVTYAITHAPALSTGPNTFTVGANTAFATAAFSTTSLTVSRRSTRSFDVTITPNAALAERGLYGGYVVLTPNNGGPPLRVPYAGLMGDYQSFQVLSTAGGLLPAIWDADLNDHPAPWTLVSAAETPNLVYQLAHQARRLDVWVMRASDGVTLGRAAELEFHPRNSSLGTVFALPWDGTYLQGTKGNKVRTAPDGDYKLVLKAEKPLAEKHNPAHIETQTSPVFTIDRP